MEKVFKPKYKTSIWKEYLTPILLLAGGLAILLLSNHNIDVIVLSLFFIGMSFLEVYLFFGNRIKRIVVSDKIAFEFYFKRPINQKLPAEVQMKDSIIQFERCSIDFSKYKNSVEFSEIINNCIANGRIRVLEEQKKVTTGNKILLTIFITLLSLGILACVCDGFLYDSFPLHIVGRASDPLILLALFDGTAVLILLVASLFRKKNEK